MIFPEIRLNGNVLPVRGNHSLGERTSFTANIGLFSAMFICSGGVYASGVVKLRPSASNISIKLRCMDLNIIVVCLSADYDLVDGLGTREKQSHYGVGNGSAGASAQSCTETIITLRQSLRPRPHE